MENKIFRNKTTIASLMYSFFLYYCVGSIIPLLGIIYSDLKMAFLDYSDYAKSTAKEELLIAIAYIAGAVFFIALIWFAIECIKAKKYDNFAFVLKEGELYFYEFAFDNKNSLMFPIQNAGALSKGINLYNLYAMVSYINNGIKNEKQIAALAMNTSKILKIDEIIRFEDNKKIINFTARCYVLTKKGFTKTVVEDFIVSKNFNDYNELKKIISERSYTNV